MFKSNIILFSVVFSIEIHSESLTLALYLHTLVSFTSPNTWSILKTKSLNGLKPGMSQLCSNILGALVQKGFFIHLKVGQSAEWNEIHQIYYAAYYIDIQIALLCLANSVERHNTLNRLSETDLIPSCIVAIHSTTDFGQFQRKSNDHVYRAHFIIASASLSDWSECQWFNANVSHAYHTRAQLRTIGKRAKYENRYK